MQSSKEVLKEKIIALLFKSFLIFPFACTIPVQSSVTGRPTTVGVWTRMDAWFPEPNQMMLSNLHVSNNRQRYMSLYCII